MTKGFEGEPNQEGYPLNLQILLEKVKQSEGLSQEEREAMQVEIFTLALEEWKQKKISDLQMFTLYKSLTISGDNQIVLLNLAAGAGINIESWT